MSIPRAGRKIVSNLAELDSPFRILFYTTITGIVVESLTMLLLLLVGQVDSLIEVVIDIFFTVTVVFPAIYLIIVQPLRKQIQDRRIAEVALKIAHAKLERRVEERTNDLAKSNAALLEEIATRKKTDEKVRLLSTALQSAANGIVITGNDGLIVWCNPAFSQMTGYSIDELHGQNPRLLKSECHDRAFYKCMWDTILEGDVWNGVLINRRKDGSYYAEEQTITPVIDEQGNISNFIAIKQDITNRRNAEQEIRQRNLELVTLNIVSTAVSRSLDLPEVLATLQRVLLDELGIPGGIIHYYDESHDCLYVATRWGFPVEKRARFIQTSVENYHCPSAIREKRPTFVPDFRQLPCFPGSPLELAPLEWRACLCVPLLADGKVQGVLDLFSLEDSNEGALPSSSPPRFNGNDINFFNALGNQVGIAIHNAHLYKTEQQARKTADILRAGSAALSQTLELDTILETLLDYLAQLIPFDHARVLLLEDENQFVVHVARGQGPKPGEVYSPSSNETIQTVVTTLKGLVIPDTCMSQTCDRMVCDHIRSWMGVPMVAGGCLIGLCVLEGNKPGLLNSDHLQMAEALVGQAAVGVQNAQLFDQMSAGRERMQSLSRRLVDVQESERRYIARELHDETGQALASLMVGLELLEQEASKPEAVVTGLSDLSKIVNDVLENLHRMAMDLRPASLDHLGLVAALRQHIEAFGEKHDYKIQFETVGVSERLPSNIETAFYRIVQEALTNVVKHAQATRIDVLLEQRDNRLILIVEDNGAGFDFKEKLESGRLGLVGMRERAEMLGGSLEIESVAGKGTTVLVEVPFDQGKAQVF
ncbi:MAG: GAF domain-containing protein [Chloroflexota bacterium]|nr:MAG: GAF domain-containing protein [Chloroflexota bacterium]